MSFVESAKYTKKCYDVVTKNASAVTALNENIQAIPRKVQLIIKLLCDAFKEGIDYTLSLKAPKQETMEGEVNLSGEGTYSAQSMVIGRSLVDAVPNPVATDKVSVTTSCPVRHARWNSKTRLLKSV